MKTKVFIDFDNTLFDTRFFKKELFDVFESFGFTNKEINDTYKRICFNYAPIKQINQLKEIRSFDYESALILIDNIFAKCPQNLFKDSKTFLEGLDKNQYEINLLTLGDKEFQQKKVEASGIAKYFDNLYFCDEEKWIFLPTIIGPKEKFFMIDDRNDALYEISKIFKNCAPIEINRTKEPVDDMEKPSPYDGPSVESLIMAVPYLSGV